LLDSLLQEKNKKLQGFCAFESTGSPDLCPEICACAVSIISAGKPVGCLKKSQ